MHIEGFNFKSSQTQVLSKKHLRQNLYCHSLALSASSFEQQAIDKAFLPLKAKQILILLQKKKKMQGFQKVTQLKEEGTLKQRYLSKKLEQMNARGSQNSASAQNSINDFFFKLQKDDIILPNPQCINCSEIFYQNQTLQSYSCSEIQWKGISELEFFSKLSLIKNLVATANMIGGGVLLAGVDPENSHKMKGIIMGKQGLAKSDAYFRDIKKEIEQTNKHLRISYQVVRVANNYLQPYHEELKITESHRYCLRISVFSIQNKLSYYVLRNKGFHPEYCFPVYKKDVKDGKEIIHEVGFPCIKLIEQLRKGGKSLKKHFGGTVSCTPPILQLKKMTNKNYDDANAIDKLDEVLDQEIRNNFLKSQQPSPKYRNVSLLIVGSEKKKIYIEKFTQNLKKDKHLFDIYRPFMEIIGIGGPAIFVFSYETKLTVMRELVKNFDKNQQILMIPTSEQFQVEKSAYMRISQQFQECLSKWYPESIQIQDSHSNMNIKSNNRNALLFAYYWMQNKGIRPYIVNTPPKTIYHKKNKTAKHQSQTFNKESGLSEQVNSMNK